MLTKQFGFKGDNMIAKNIIKYAATYLGLSDLLTVNLLDGEQVATKEQEAEINILLSCLNLVVNQIASEYVTLKNKVKLNSINGKVYYSSLSNNVVVDVLSVKLNGVDVKFNLKSDHLETACGNLEIEFAYQPSGCVSTFSTVDFNNIKINERIIAYGVVAEYCFLNASYDDAAIWDNRFKTSINNVVRPRREIKIKERLWI